LPGTTWAFRGEHAVSNGWLQRARSLLAGLPDCAEQAWLEVREGSLCLMEDGDPDRAHTLAAEGIRLARASHNVDLEMLASPCRDSPWSRPAPYRKACGASTR